MNVLHWAAKVCYLEVVQRVFRACSDTVLLKLLQAKSENGQTPKDYLGCYYSWGGPSDLAVIRNMFDTKLAQIQADVASRYHLDDVRRRPQHCQARNILNSYGIVVPSLPVLSQQVARREVQEIPSVQQIKRGF